MARSNTSPQTLAATLNQETGGASLYLIIFLTVGAMAVSALFIDYARLYITRRGAQNGADAAALAGAGECAQRLNDIHVIKKGGISRCGVPEAVIAREAAEEYQSRYSQAVTPCGTVEAASYLARNRVSSSGGSVTRRNGDSRSLGGPSGVGVVLTAQEMRVSRVHASFPPLISGAGPVKVPADATAEAYPDFANRLRTYFKRTGYGRCGPRGELNWYEVSLEVAWRIQLNR